MFANDSEDMRSAGWGIDPRAMINDLTNGELAILPGLHHLTSWEDPDLVNSVLLEFLGRHAQ